MPESAMDMIREGGPMKNQNHNLIHSLARTLDSVARNELYRQDAREMGCNECEELWNKLGDLDRQQAQLLQQEIKSHVQNDIFD